MGFLSLLVLTSAPLAPANEPVLQLDVQFAQLYDHPAARELRTSLGGMEAEWLHEWGLTFLRDTGLHPKDVESFTVFLPSIRELTDVHYQGVIVTTRQEYDRDALLGRASQGVPPPERAELTALNYAQVMHFESPRTLVLLHPDIAADYLDGAFAIERSADHALTLSLDFRQLPVELLLADLPPDVRPYVPLLKCDTIEAHVDVGDAFTGTAILKSSSVNPAEVEEALKFWVRLMEQQFAEATGDDVLAWIQPGGDLAGAIQSERDEQRVRASWEWSLGEPSGVVWDRFVAGLRPLVEQSVSEGRLRQIAYAMHEYASVHNSFPPAAVTGPTGEPILSWRVLLLPHLGHQDLYDQFRLDESWESEHNRKLLDQMPAVYAITGTGKDESQTRYQVLAGNGAAFDPLLPTPFPSEFADGTSNTILVVEAAEAVPWTAPALLHYDPDGPLPKFHYRDGRCRIALCDGFIFRLSERVSETSLRRGIERNDGMVLGADFFD